MNKVTIYFEQCNGFGWHWMLDRGGLPTSSTEAFANAVEAEKVAKSIAQCNEVRYMGVQDDSIAQARLERRDRPTRIPVPNDPTVHQDRGINWGYNGTYNAHVERWRR